MSNTRSGNTGGLIRPRITGTRAHGSSAAAAYPGPNTAEAASSPPAAPVALRKSRRLVIRILPTALSYIMYSMRYADIAVKNFPLTGIDARRVATHHRAVYGPAPARRDSRHARRRPPPGPAVRRPPRALGARASAGHRPDLRRPIVDLGGVRRAGPPAVGCAHRGRRQQGRPRRVRRQEPPGLP